MASKFQTSSDTAMNKSHDEILRFLRQQGAPVHTLVIAKHLGYSTRKEVNPMLYRLHAEGLLDHVSQSPPFWSLKKDLKVSSLRNRKSQNDSSELTSVLKQLSLGDWKQKARETRDERRELPKNITSTIEENMDVGLRPPVISSDDFKFLNENSISAFMEYSQKMHLPGQLVDSGSEGPPHCSRFRAYATLGNYKFPIASGSTKKEAKLMAAETAMKIIAIQGLCNVKGLGAVDKVQNPSRDDSEVEIKYPKSPISEFITIGQKSRMSADILITSCTGPSHSPRYEAVAVLGDKKIATGRGKSKQEARKNAAELALREISISSPNLKSSSSTMNNISSNFTTGIFDDVATASHEMFYKLSFNLPERVTSGRKILAAITMSSGQEPMVVVSIGTGNVCVSGDRISGSGVVLNDCHAEVIARRAFRRFLWNQLAEFQTQGSSAKCIFELGENDLLKLKDGVTFHLYISTAPCGDGAVYSHNSLDQVHQTPTERSKGHSPTYEGTNSGHLRVKVENGQGTIPITEDEEVPTLDGVLLGQRLCTMSCSDKIAKWNVLGLQGALLSHFVSPIYLSTITIGQLFSNGHLVRAVCCRLAQKTSIDLSLPPTYHLNHPAIGTVSCTISRNTLKTKQYSLNWCVGDTAMEVVDGSTGMSFNSNGETFKSRLCKLEMFKEFQKMCLKFRKEHLISLSLYLKAKAAAKHYHEAQTVMEKWFCDLGMGSWMHKPTDEKVFYH